MHVAIDGIHSKLCSSTGLFSSEEDVALEAVRAPLKELGRAKAVDTPKVEITAGTNDVAVAGADQSVRQSSVHELLRLGVDIQERDTAAVDGAFVGRRKVWRMKRIATRR